MAHPLIFDKSHSSVGRRQVGRRTFSLRDQVQFAAWSGDNNPLHVDSAHARRSVAGGLTVHGIHLILWALEQALEQGVSIDFPEELHATFLRPALIDMSLECWLVSIEATDIVCLLITNIEGSELARIELRSGIRKYASDDDGILCSEAYAESTPVRIEWNDLCQISGDLKLHCAGSLHADVWPRVCETFGVDFAVFLGSTSRLVGVECPGLNSLYSELQLWHADANCEERSVIRYEVTRADPRFKLVDINVSAEIYFGKIRAFARPELLAPVSMDSVVNRAPVGAFCGQRALVIGGSRGIGEVAAKLLAAAGAEVCLTYNVGREDAERVVADIRSAGADANSAQLDILANDGQCELVIRSFRPTHLFYCATPFIFSGNREQFSDQLLEKFRDYYVRGFEHVLRIAYVSGLRYAWYPSSTALDEQPADMREYCAAKLEGEALIVALVKALPDLKVSCPRLPRTATDQTNGIVVFDSADPVTVFLSCLSKNT